MTEQSTMTPEMARQIQHLKDKREQRAKEFGGRLVFAEDVQVGDRVISAYGPASQARKVDRIKFERSRLAMHRDGFTLYMEDGGKPVNYSRNSWLILLGR